MRLALHSYKNVIAEGKEIDMDKERFIENITEQIKEAQLKLGYTKETIRLYFPVRSLCDLICTEPMEGKDLVDLLEKEFQDTVLGRLTFILCKGDRIEVCISAAGAEYVHGQVADPPFLAGIIELFRNNHCLTIEEISTYFAKFSENYVCEKMEPGTEFDYVLYFADGKPDPWYYCVKIEMGHTIYHRFTEADYRSLTANISL